jgi:hypothetical protein
MFRRRIRIYCVGAAKTGTHSVESLFKRRYRAAHEPLLFDLLDMLDSTGNGPLPDAEAARSFLKRRDAALGLELESSHMLGRFVAPLASAFPNSPFILTVREPIDWLNSMLNDQLKMSRSPEAHRWMRIYTSCIGPHATGQAEAPLAALDLYPLRAYLEYWRSHYQHVLQSIPPERLLVLATESLAQQLDVIERRLRLKAGSLDQGGAHTYVNPAKGDLVGQLGRDYVAEQVERHCGEIYRRLLGMCPPTVTAQRQSALGPQGH